MTNRLRIIAAGLLATLALGAAACGASDDDDDSASFREEAAGRAALDEGKAPPPAATAAGSNFAYGSSTAGGDGTGTSVNQSIERKIIYNTSLAMTVPGVEQAFYEVQRMASNAQGYVERSNLSVRSTDEGAPQFASITLRVPVTAYDGLLDSLRRLEGAKVTREEGQSTEVTEEYTDLQSRLRNLEQTETQYLKLLEQATTIPDILSVNERIDGIRMQIEQIQGRINLLDNLTGLATIDVQLSAVAVAQVQAKPDGGIPTVAEAFEGALEFSAGALRLLAAGAAVAAVAALWAVPLFAIALLGRKLFVKGRNQPAA